MATFYVAPDGNDANPGTEACPFATPARGCAAARAAGDNRHVVLRGGAYYAVALSLGAEDAGLTLEAAPGETPVLYGGRIVTEWRRDGDWLVASLPGVQAGRWDFRALVVNGRLCPRARLPETGRYTHESVFDVPWMSSSAGGWKRKPTRVELTTLRYREDDLDTALDLRNAELTIYHAWDESMVGLRAHDPATQTLTFSTPAGHPPGAFGYWQADARTYVVWNTRAGMTQPGQWYLDRTLGTLVYWPLPGETAENIHAVAPTCERIIDIDGAADITLRGLTFAATTTPLVAGGFGAERFDGAITACDAAELQLQHLTIATVGGYGVKLKNCNRAVIDGCTVSQCGAGGIQGRGLEHLQVTDNHIHHVGLAYPSGIGLYVGAPDARIAHNTIHDATYSGINCSGSHRGVVERNHISRVMLELKDGGAIYFIFTDDLVVRHNVVRDIESSLGHGYYIDEKSARCVVEGNLAVNVPWPSHNHMAPDGVLRHNVFVTSGPATLSFILCNGFTVEGNIISAGEEIIISTRGDGDIALANNICYSGAGVVDREHSEDSTRTPLTAADGMLPVDPGFIDATAEDFRFRPDSPAIHLGIPPLDVAGAGCAR